MKTTLRFILTLFTFTILVFVPNNFAQDASPEYVVRVIYFLPNDRQPKPDIDKMLDTKIKEAQRFFADQLEAHGFDRKTFRIETDDTGNAIVHHVNGRHDDAYYQNPSFGSHSAMNEITEQFDMSKNIYYIALDSSSIFLDGSEIQDTSGITMSGITGWASGNGVSGVAFVTTFDKVPTIHELGHAFGLTHDYRSNFKAKRVYTSNFHGIMTTTFCAAEWLYTHRYFNPNPGEINNNTDIQFHPPELIEPLTKIRLRFTLTDPDGLHQVQLLHPQRFLPGEYNHFAGINEATLAACQKLSGKQATVEFVTHDLVGRNDATNEIAIANKIVLKIIDVSGNITTRLFDIDITPLISFHEVVSIPDRSLAAAIREELDLASDDPITNLNMLQLSEFAANDRNIKNLTGLESAIYLRVLDLAVNQIEDISLLSQLEYLNILYIGFNKIRDITPLKTLKHLGTLHLGNNPISDITVLTSLPSLEVLSISSNPILNITQVWELTHLRGLSLSYSDISDISPIENFEVLTTLGLNSNKITDITPLAGLTGLRSLNLYHNEIIDITPLAGLTGLTDLRLSGNQISDVSPLTALVNLKTLELAQNPIKNRKPLFELLEKNPDVKIYLKWGGEPLPVSLSYFRAELTDTGVILKWTTESEVNNAGFYIYRSQTKDGKFKVVNPTMIQGAGTTSERHTYTWTDTAAKPNVAYYYRIEDISHAGVRKQLATVRMRGLVSASGKLTTKWADLKIQED